MSKAAGERGVVCIQRMSRSMLIDGTGDSSFIARSSMAAFAAALVPHGTHVVTAKADGPGDNHGDHIGGLDL